MPIVRYSSVRGLTGYAGQAAGVFLCLLRAARAVAMHHTSTGLV